MRTALLYCLLLLIVGCTSIENLEPNQTNTFLKFYSETSTMESKDLIVLEDGFLILSTYSDTTSLLLKTDLLGNKLWAQALLNFSGSAITSTNQGYIVIGDSINTQDGTTFMQLIDINKETGSRLGSAFIGTGSTHGSAVSFTSNGEVNGLGYTSTTSGNSIILNSYTSDLSPIWAAPRIYLSELPANSLYEENGLITWLSYYSNKSNISLTTVLPDNEGNESNPTLLNGQTLANTNGDLVNTPSGYGIVQTVIGANGEAKIGYSSVINGIIDKETILVDGDFSDGNFNGYTLTNTLNGLLIAATTDKHIGEKERNDADLLLLEISVDGSLVSGGINQTFGGIGHEIPVRIRKAIDGGYVILGTSINSKGAQQSFLLKTNSKGLLN